MPLLKKRPFPLLPSPSNLRPDETVWQIRFTNEIFTSYSYSIDTWDKHFSFARCPVGLYKPLESRPNSVPQIWGEKHHDELMGKARVWSCRLTGKMHLTYEEALISEEETKKQLLQFPEMFVAHVLHMVQFSMLKMNDLVTLIDDNLKDTFVQGEELLGRLENSDCPCKIMKVLSRDGGPSYEVGWLNENREVTTTSIENKHKLTRKKFPFSRGLLKLFIKESTSQNSPWVIHSKLAKKYRISTKPPKEIEDKIIKGAEITQARKKKRESESDKIEKIKYPIEDLLVKPSAEDPAFTARPVPSDKFRIPLDDVGNLLTVWDFLLCFGKLLHLSPFSLDEFENAIVYEGVSNLIVEAHICILTLLIDDHGAYYNLIRQRKKKEMIPVKGWSEYLCDFLELESETEFAHHVRMIRNGNYSILDVHAKLEILVEMLHAAISTGAVRGQLDMCIEQQQSLAASKREEDLAEMRNMREEKRLKGTKDGDYECPQENKLKGINQSVSDSMSYLQTDLHNDDSTSASASIETEHTGNRGSKLDVLKSRRALMKKSLEEKISTERGKELSRTEELKRLREENRIRAEELKQKRLKEQRSMQFEKEMEKVQIQTFPLGKDRDRNTYWFFHREGRLFVESADHNTWGYYFSKEEVDTLLSYLNPKGVRELSLRNHLEKYYLKICSAMQKRSKELAQRVVLEDPAILRRSVRVSALPKDKKKGPSFLRYVNKWRTK